MAIRLGFVEPRTPRQFFVTCIREKQGQSTIVAPVYVYATSAMLACEKAEWEVAESRGEDVSDWFAYRVEPCTGAEG